MSLHHEPKPRSMNVSLPLLACVMTIGVAACGGDAQPVEDPSEEACEHVREGPANSAAASAVADATAGDVSAEHTRHDVTLVDIEDGEGAAAKGGFVQLDSGGGVHRFYLTKEIPLALLDESQEPVEIANATAEDTCAEVLISHSAVLPVGKVFVSFGPTEETEVSLIVEPVVFVAEDE